METLDEIRKEIDKTDSELLDLFIYRMSLSDKVASVKIKDFAPIFRPDREKAILNGIASRISGELSTKGKSFFSTLMLLSREKQYSAYIKGGAVPDSAKPFSVSYPLAAKRICYYGDKGSWSNLAAIKFSPESEAYGKPLFSDVFSEVASGNADAGILPIENSTAGSIREVYDLLAKNELFICSALNVDIRYCLASVAGATKQTVRKVYSHSQALSQCREYLIENGFSAEPYENTAGAAILVKSLGDPAAAALCNKSAVEEYGLEVLESDICDASCNTTRFIVVSSKPYIAEDADTISLGFSVDHESGTLSRVLDIFRDLGINISKLESRPIPKERFRYSFYLDFCGSLRDDGIKSLLLQLESELEEIKVLGNYKVKED